MLSYGLGAVFNLNSVQRNMQTSSFCIMGTEVKYAQIEKESLALTWACEHFCDYLIGNHYSQLIGYKITRFTYTESTVF